MKLIITIIPKNDCDTVSLALTERKFRVTQIASTGGFLRKGNATLLQSPVVRNSEAAPSHDKAPDISIRSSKLDVSDQSIEGAALNIVQAPDYIIRENLFRCPISSYMVPFHTYYPVRDALGQIYLMKVHDNRDSTVLSHV